MSSKKKQLFKIIILGDSGYGLRWNDSVGKTSLMNQYVNARFTQQYRATVGADFMAKEVMIDDRMVTLQVSRCISRRFGTRQARSASNRWAVRSTGVLTAACWSMTSPTRRYLLRPISKSFDSLDSWRDEFLMQGQPKDPENFPFVVLGNKLDKANERKVPDSIHPRWLTKKPSSGANRTAIYSSLRPQLRTPPT